VNFWELPSGQSEAKLHTLKDVEGSTTRN